jgi:16S rRNA (guanine966-N2)-methyltransferase
LRGRKLDATPSPATRPTSDRVREGVASALEARAAFAGANVLDLFAGTGALGFEALSRGAQSVLALDNDRSAVRCMQQNAAALALNARFRVLQLDLLGAPHKLASAIGRRHADAPFTLVFTDPPYTLVQEAVAALPQWLALGLIAPGALVVFEHPTRQAPACPDCCSELANYRYGDTGVALWKTIAESQET